MNENSNVNSLVDQLFNKKGGTKKKSNTRRVSNKDKQGGDVITPFLSALALLGTRIANDKRFLNSKFNLNASKPNKSSTKRRYKEEMAGGDQTPQNISNMMSSLGALSGNAQMDAKVSQPDQNQAVSALTGGKYSRKRGGNGTAAAAVLEPVTSQNHNTNHGTNHSHQEYFAAQNNAVLDTRTQVMPPQLPATGGKRRSVNHKRRSVSPKRRAAPKRATRRT
jgi:hypothetical protein